MISLANATVQPNAVMISFDDAHLTMTTMKCTRWHVFVTFGTMLRMFVIVHFIVTAAAVADQQRRFPLLGNVGQIVCIVRTLNDMI